MPIYTVGDEVQNGGLSVLRDTDDDVIVYTGNADNDVDLVTGARSRLGGRDFRLAQSEAEFLSNKVDFVTKQPVRGDIVSVSDVTGARVTLTNGDLVIEINPDVSDLSGSTVGVTFDFTLADGRTFGVAERFLYHNLTTELSVARLSATVEDFLSGGGDDVLRGNAVDNLLSGGAGRDELYGRAGNDTLEGGAGRDTLDGGSGLDVASFAGETMDLIVTLGGASNALDTFRSIEGLSGGIGDDAFTGDAGANALSGAAGADTLDGGGGADTLVGGIGGDALTGGEGADLLYGDLPLG